MFNASYFTYSDNIIIISIESDTFDLYNIAESGQCFRWYIQDDGSVAFLFGGCAVLGYREKTGEEIDDKVENIKLIVASTSLTPDEMYKAVLKYLDAETDYTSILESIDKKDAHLKEAASYGRGVRILNSPLWETIIGFMISQNNNIPRIKKSVRLISERFGNPVSLTPIEIFDNENRSTCKTKLGITFNGNPIWPDSLMYEFPSPDRIDVNNLDDLGLGYRQDYLKELINDVKCGKNEILSLLLDSNISNEDKLDELLKIRGIGQKVANCIMLFALHDVKAFPRDTWVKKIEEKYYKGRFPCEKYPLSAGIMQQYLFYYEISHK